jgi:nicotinamidase-related amidase
MSEPLTLFQLAGRKLSPPKLGEAALVLIDYQNEYLDGPLLLVEPEAAIARASALLAAARAAGTRIFHIAQRGALGGTFDRTAPRGAIVAALTPREGETVVEKTLPNSFAGTGLAERIGGPGTPVVFAGFMTHNCVSSSVRAGKDLGYVMTVAADACATRDLPLPRGFVSAADLHRAELAGLADHHALVVDVADLIA